MNPANAYFAAVEDIGRPKRELKLCFPEGWQEGDRPSALLVLAGGWAFDFGDWPAFGFVFGRGTYVLGHTIPGSAFPRALGMPKLFEGSQCALEVADQVLLRQDYSTNGTLVIPPEEARAVPALRLDDALRTRWNSPLPRAIRPHDVVLTQYAEFVLVAP